MAPARGAWIGSREAGDRQRAVLRRGGAWRDSLRDFGVWKSALARTGRLWTPTIRCFDPSRALLQPGGQGTERDRSGQTGALSYLCVRRADFAHRRRPARATDPAARFDPILLADTARANARVGCIAMTTMSLHDRVALVTGAADGIGAAVARTLAAAGAPSSLRSTWGTSANGRRRWPQSSAATADSTCWSTTRAWFS